MPEDADFLAAIIAEPDDDTVRLIYADWLEEHGRPGRAEFIRLQCRIADLGRELMSGEDCESAHCPGCVERRGLRRRERELLAGHRYSWCDGLPGPGWKTGGLRLDDGNGPVHVAYHRGTDTILPIDIEVGFCRGFVEQVTLSSAGWFSHGSSLLATAPVTEVTLTDLPWLRWDGPGRVSFSGNLFASDVGAGEPHAAKILALLVAGWPRVKTWNLPT